MVDRRSRDIRVVHVPKVKTDVVAEATAIALKGLTSKTLTNDNGSNFNVTSLCSVTVRRSILSLGSGLSDRPPRHGTSRSVV
ncbi:MAG: hypothetical protein JWO36_3737 [Myxococcales bacterium]|nr:hypothetical protein [Myxococcales bacterium]